MKQITDNSACRPHGQRLEALDAMRGLTVALMIMVNSGLWGTPIFHHLHHAAWNGLTAADLVFPWFVYIMGVGMAFSLRRYGYALTGRSAAKVARRTALIFLIGLALDYVEKGMSGVVEGLDFSRIRIMGVLPRLALSYGGAALLALALPERAVKWTVGAVLAGYGALLLLADGFEASTANVVARVDLALLGENHMYHDWLPERTAFDPEGLLGTIPSVAHVLIGYLCGRMLLNVSDNGERMNRLLLAGFAMAFAGFLLEAGVPVNKKVWSPTFVLVSCGLGAQLLAALIWLIDVKGRRRLLPAVTVFGVNPLALYVFSSLLAELLWTLQAGGMALPQLLYVRLLEPLFGSASEWPSLLWAAGLTAICWLAGYPLWRRRIYIKI